MQPLPPSLALLSPPGLQKLEGEGAPDASHTTAGGRVAVDIQLRIGGVLVHWCLCPGTDLLPFRCVRHAGGLHHCTLASCQLSQCRVGFAHLSRRLSPVRLWLWEEWKQASYCPGKRCARHSGVAPECHGRLCGGQPVSRSNRALRLLLCWAVHPVLLSGSCMHWALYPWLLSSLDENGHCHHGISPSGI